MKNDGLFCIDLTQKLTVKSTSVACDKMLKLKGREMGHEYLCNCNFHQIMEDIECMHHECIY